MTSHVRKVLVLDRNGYIIRISQPMLLEALGGVAWGDIYSPNIINYYTIESNCYSKLKIKISFWKTATYKNSDTNHINPFFDSLNMRRNLIFCKAIRGVK